MATLLGNTPSKKDTWTFPWESTLACIGITYGTEMIWRMPYYYYRYSGIVFLPYILFQLTVGLPLVFMMLTLGQFTSSGILTCWKFAPICTGIGVSSFIHGLMILTYLGPAMSHFVPFLFTAGEHVDRCSNSWLFPSPCSWQPSEYASKPEYLKEIIRNYQVGTLANIGPIQWRTAVPLLGIYVVVILMLSLGVRSLGKVAYFTTIFPLIGMFAFLIRGQTLNEGRTFSSFTRMENLRDPYMWINVFAAVLWDNTIGFGVYVTYGSHNKFHNDTFRDSLLLIFIRVVLSIVSTFGFTKVWRYSGHDVVAGVFSMFADMPGVLSTLPDATAWKIIFCLICLCSAVNVMGGIIQTIVTGISDCLPNIFNSRIKRFRLLFATCCTLFLLSLPATTQAEMKITALLDAALVPTAYLVSFLSCYAIGYFYGIFRFFKDCKVMFGERVLVCIPWQILYLGVPFLCFITPWMLKIFLILQIDKYNFVENWRKDKVPMTEHVGMFLTLLPLLPVVVVAVVVIIYYFITTPGELTRKLSRAVSPTPFWGPAEIQHRQEVYETWKKYGFVLSPYDSFDNIFTRPFECTQLPINLTIDDNSNSAMNRPADSIHSNLQQSEMVNSNSDNNENTNNERRQIHELQSVAVSENQVMVDDNQPLVESF